MRKFLFIILFSGAALAFPPQYHGQFSEVTSTGSPCDTIFAVTTYDANHYLTGVNHLTSVLHFISPSQTGFFDNLTLIGLMGYNNDIEADKTFEQDGWYYNVHSEGIVDYQFLVDDITVSISKTENGPALCTAKGEYSGFPH